MELLIYISIGSFILLGIIIIYYFISEYLIYRKKKNNLIEYTTI